MHFHICHECDEVCKISDPHKVGSFRCPNCGHRLYSNRPGMVEEIYAYNIAAIILFAVTNYFPFLSFQVMGMTSHANFATSILYLFKEQQWLMGLAILLTTIVVPLMRILLYLLLTGPIYHGYHPPYAKQLLVLLEKLLPWGMIDVFLVGVLVSIVKLVKMGTIIPGTSLWAFMVMVFVMAAAQAKFDPHIFWERIGKEQKRRRAAA